MLKRLFLVIFSLGLFEFSFAQTIESLKSSAVILIENGDFEKAIPMLKRCLFFADETAQFDLLIKLGEANVAIDSFEKAHSYFQLAVQKAPNDSLYDEIIFKATAVFLKQNKPKQAIKALENNIKSVNSTYFIQRKYFYLALSHYQLHDYKTAENDFYNCFKSNNKSLSDSIQILFDKLANTHFYNPKKAKTLSILLPGLGQFYAKDYKNSINSFGINAGLLGLGIWSAIVYTPFDGIIWVAPWLRRYYIGGYKKAELIAISQNEKIEKAYLSQILNTIENNNHR